MDEVTTRFRNSLQSRRYPGPGSKGSFFYIYEDLQDITTEVLIADLVGLNCPDQAVEDVAASIRSSGIRLFCILVLMNQVDQIPNFLAHNTLDSRLPIREEAELHHIAPDIGGLFFTKYQWQFFPCFFRKDYGHLILPDPTILPFTSDETIAEGSGGVISSVKIPVQQQNFFTEVRLIKPIGFAWAYV